jgi:hypothetical protein
MNDVVKNMLLVFVVNLLIPAFILSQDIEEGLTQNSEAFLSLSQNFVNLASQNINVDADYYAALKLSFVADEFHQHSSYLTDFVLITEIVKRQKPEKELIEEIMKSRISNVVNLCKTAEKGIESILTETENPEITNSAFDLRKELTRIQEILAKI